MIRLLALTSVLLVLAVSPAAAHAVLERASPPPNASVATSPPQLTLVFSEPVVAAVGGVMVTDSAGRSVAERAVLQPDGRTLVMALPLLVGGVYTVRWRVLSEVDGHATSGFYVIAVGQELPAAAAAEQRGEVPPPAVVLIRWVELAGALLLAGIAFFEYVVLRPVRNAGMVLREAAAVVTGRLRRLTILAALVLLASAVVEFVLQAVTLLGTTVAGFLTSGLAWILLVQTKPGWGLLIRFGMGALLLVPSTPRARLVQMAGLIWLAVVGGIAAVLAYPDFRGISDLGHLAILMLTAAVYGLVSALAALILPLVPDIRLPEASWVPPAAGAVLLSGFTVVSHAIGVGRVAALADWVHLMAAAAWIGGLVALLVVLAAAPPVRDMLAPHLVPRFSRLAAISLAVLVVTGAYSAWLHIPEVRAFVVTVYGRALGLKLLLVLPLIGLGALNRFVLRPQLERGEPVPGALGRFVRSARAEVVLGTLVVLAVGVMTTTPPAAVSMPVPSREPLVLAGLAGDARIALTITPAEAGWNRFEAAVMVGGADLTTDQARVLLRLRKLDEEIDATTLTLRPRSDGVFVHEGGELALTGWWEIGAVVRRRGRLDVSTVFPLWLGNATDSSSDPDAAVLLGRVQRAMSRAATWRETEQISDGSGGFVVTQFEMMRPDRLRYRTAGGAESVIIGADRYYRPTGGTWEKDRLPDPIRIDGPYLVYLAGSRAVRFGRLGTCDAEACRVVTWEAPSGSAAFAAWIGLETHRIHRFYMAAPSHYMTSRPMDFNEPLQITAPN